MRLRLITLLSGLAAVALLAACQPVRTAPDWEVMLFKAEDQAQARWEGPDLVLDILSPSGIGGMRLTWPGDLPSGALVLRLHLAGLEGLRVTNEAGAAALAVTSSPPYDVRAEGKIADITIQRAEGWFDVRLGPTWLQTGSLAVEWVDFYR
jgi:hypothetical protein